MHRKWRPSGKTRRGCLSRHIHSSACAFLALSRKVIVEFSPRVWVSFHAYHALPGTRRVLVLLLVGFAAISAMQSVLVSCGGRVA